MEICKLIFARQIVPVVSNCSDLIPIGLIPRTDRTMEIAQLVVSPAILLGAFIFFWKESKAGRLELETRLVKRMDRMEDRLEARIVALEVKIDGVETRIDEVSGYFKYKSDEEGTRR